MRLAHLSPRRALHRSLFIALFCLAGSFANEADSATTHFVTAFCSGGGQLCNDIKTFTVNVPNGATGGADFRPGPLTCSDVRIHFFVDGVEKALTGFAGPGGDTGFVSLGFVSQGKHTIGVQAEGEVGGCNAGTLGSWAGTVTTMKLEAP